MVPFQFGGGTISCPPGTKFLITLFLCAGDVGVGKSCLLLQFTEKKCKSSYVQSVEVFNWSSSRIKTYV